jgi:4-amino-4-deoxy-L-arabinose transferase-like glycosyltransferase
MKNRFPQSVCLLVLLAIFSLALAGITDHDLWTPDEPRVCCISQTMWQTRDWAVPRLAGEIFIEKPPLYFWLCGAFGRAFGSLFEFTGAARLSCTLCALGTLAAAAWMAYLLRRRRRDALFAVLVLATMPQFLLEMHWMRTDVLLAFFVAASTAFLVLAYRHNRPWALLPAGLAAAGAFLSKGPIGWILIAPAAIPLALQAFLSERGRPARGRWLSAHLLAVLLALGLSALWVFAIYRHPDPAAWKAWFWDNQIGRTTGSATALGHHNPWAIHYYIVLLPVVLGPWFPHLVHALSVRVRDFRRNRPPWKTLLASPAFMLACWGFGGLLLLTIPSTKRGVYLLPLYPAYALLAAAAIPLAANRFYRVWTAVWEALAVLLAAAMLLLPAIAHLGLPPDYTISPVVVPLVHWTPYHTVTLVLALLWLVLRRPFRAARDPDSLALRLFLANAFLWLTVFAVPFQAIDAGKSIRAATLRIASALPSDTSRVAAYRLDETSRAALEYYAGVVLAPLDIPRDSNNVPIRELAAPAIEQILVGAHPRFTAILAQARRSRDKIWPPEAEAASATLSGSRHVYFLAPQPSHRLPTD